MKYFFYKQLFLTTDDQLVYIVPNYLSKFTFGCKFENKSQVSNIFINFKIINKKNEILFNYKNLTIDELNNILSEIRTLEENAKIYISSNTNLDIFFTLFLILHEDRPLNYNIERPYIISPIENSDVKGSDITIECSPFFDLTGQDKHVKTEYKISLYPSGLGPVTSSIINKAVTTFKITDISELENYQEYYLFVRYYGENTISQYSFARKIRVIKEFKFKYKFDTTLYGEDNNKISLGFYLPNYGSLAPIKVDWGDDTETSYLPKTRFDGENSYHTYDNAGTYIVTIETESLPTFTDNLYFKKTLIEILDPIPPIIEETIDGLKLIEKFTFNNFPNLRILPEKFLQNNYQITSLENAFSNNTSLTQLPKLLLYGLKNVENCNLIFQNSSIKNYPDDIFKYLPNLKTCKQSFLNNNISNISNYLFISNINLEDISECFKNTNIISINENIFINNINLKYLNGTFENCLNLEFIPENVFKNNINIIEINNLFKSCKKIKNIPNKLFKKNINIQSAKSTFENCPSISLIPDNLFRNINVPTTYDYCFKDCTSLLSIPELLFNEKASSLVGTFKNCSNIIVIANDTFKNCQYITTFESCFENCVSLRSFSNKIFSYSPAINSYKKCFKNIAIQEIPESLFLQSVNVISFEGCFEDCQFLKIIPDNLFISNINVENLKDCFKNCGMSINSDEYIQLPSNLFKNNNKIIDISGCFFNAKIKEIPNELFINNIKIKYIDNCFNSSSIKSIPSTLFEQNTSILSASGCFKNCLNLEFIPENLFKNLLKLENINECFYGLKIINIPKNIFKTTTRLKYINSCFENCKNITTIPENIFDTLINLIDVSRLFCNCSKINSIPGNLFINNKKINNFNRCFYNLILASYSDIFDDIDFFKDTLNAIDLSFMFYYVGDDKTVNMSAPEYWKYNYPNGVTNIATFRRSKNIEYVINYKDIPTTWK